MFIKILRLLIIIHSFNIDNDYNMNSILIEQKEAAIRQYVTELKIIFKKFEGSRNEEIGLFKSTFQGIVEYYNNGRNKAALLLFLSTLAPEKHFDTRAPLSITFPHKFKSFIVKKLFFNDLLFYYYDFCYKINNKFFEIVTIYEKNLDEIEKLLIDLRKMKNISFKELGFDRLIKLANGYFNIYVFFRELKGIVCEIFDMEDYQIYLIFDSFRWLDMHPYDSKEYYLPYKGIHHFIKYHNASISMRKNEKSCLPCKKIFRILEGCSRFTFESMFLNCLTLNITEECKIRLRSPENTRFKMYNESQGIINSCQNCLNYCKDMLRNVPCVSHQTTLDTIRTEHFEFMDCSWFSVFILNRKVLLIELLTFLSMKQIINYSHN